MSNDRAIDIEFTKETLQAAKELGRDFHIEIEKNESLGFIGFCVEMPTIMNDGLTEEECKKNTRESIEVCLAFMLEDNIPIPSSHILREKEYLHSDKVAGMLMFTTDNQHFYITNQSGSGNIWMTESIDVLRVLHKKLGDFIDEVEK